MNKFMVLFGIFIVCILVSGCAALKTDPWTKDQILLQGVASTLKIVDWGTTLDMVGKPGYYEANPIIGRHPNRRDINKYFACSFAAQIFITHILPSSWRKYWLGSNILISGYCVKNNYGIGLRANF